MPRTRLFVVGQMTFNERSPVAFFDWALGVHLGSVLRGSERTPMADFVSCGSTPMSAFTCSGLLKCSQLTCPDTLIEHGSSGPTRRAQRCSNGVGWALNTRLPTRCAACQIDIEGVPESPLLSAHLNHP